MDRYIRLWLTIISLEFASVVLFGCGHRPIHPQPKKSTLISLQYSFHTTNGDDKDWDTRVGAEVRCNNHDVAQRFDFNHDKHVDHWDNNSDQGPWELPVNEKIDKAELNKCIYRISAEANGNDNWTYDAYLYATFSDGTKRQWSFIGGDLNSRDSQTVHNDYSMESHHD